jgi:hypothetical protein
VVTIRGNGTVKTISVSQRKGPRPKLPEVFVSYNFAKGLTDEEEDRFLASEADLFAVGTVTISQTDFVEPPNTIEEEPKLLLQQTQANYGLGQVVEVQKEATGHDEAPTE